MPRVSTKSKKAFLKFLFEKLHTHYGPQNWWPGDNPFEIAVGAILTQNTNWRNVELAIANLKREALVFPDAIYHVPAPELGVYIRPCGFYNLKSKRLKDFVAYLKRNYHGKMAEMKRNTVRALRRELLEINGIGPETCDAILLYALGKPVFVVDAYTRRILSRHGLIVENATYEEIRALFEGNVRKEERLYNEYHALLVRLGKERCKIRDPLCEGCPLEGIAGSRE